MTLLWQPIHPASSPLLEMAPETLRFAEGPVYSGLSVTCSHFDLQVMTDLKFKFASTEGKAHVQYFLLEVAAYTAGVHSAETNRGRLFFVRRGVGFRVGVASWNVEFKAASDLATVAANAEFKSASTSVEVQTFGGDAISSLKVLQRLLAAKGLDANVLKDVAGAGEELSDLISGATDLEPADLHIATIDTGITQSWMETAYSLQFAVESIYRQKTLLTAYRSFASRNDKKQRELFNSLIPRAAYTNFGIPNEATRPSDTDRADAGRILNSGR